MQKLALDDELLLQIEQPARYIGGEINMVKKDPDQVAVRFAMCFPDVYEIGMSHLGIQILYSMFNRREDVYCERVFSPWTDLDRLMRERHIPLFTQMCIRDRLHPLHRRYAEESADHHQPHGHGVPVKI